MERITKMGLPLTVLAIVGAFVMAVTTTNITPAAAQDLVEERPLDAVRGIVDRSLSVVENPEQLLGLLLDGREQSTE